MRAARERGQVLVEFTFAVGFTLLLLFGIIDFGRAAFAYNVVTSGAQLGGRYAAVRGSSCTTPACTASATDIETYVRGKSPGIDASLLSVTTTWGPYPSAGCAVTVNPPPPYDDPGCLVSVRVDYPFHFTLLPNVDIPMTDTFEMIISQ